MKRMLLPFFVLISFVIVNNTANAQGIKLGIGGGLTSIQSPDLYTEDEGLGFSSEYHFGGKIKFDIPIVPITPYAHITYHKFS
ncbi:MAG: hypothetical protein R6W90_17485, partial [Ignavibacteriaceae bacterium]